MKKILMSTLVVIMTVLWFGCKGEKGDAGLPGITGPTGDFELLSGSVTNNSFSVSDARFGTAEHITVYIGDASGLTELPYFLPGLGINTYFVFKPLVDTIDIINAQAAGATIYIIAIG